MKRRNGFTLIELLAVIVILAIIAVIAVPIVLNIIDGSKNNATLRSAEMYLDAVELSIANRVMHHGSIPDDEYPIMSDGNICLKTYNKTSTSETCTDTDNIDDNEILEVEVKGEKPTSGTIYIKTGQIFKEIDDENSDKITRLEIGGIPIQPIKGEDGKVKFEIVDSNEGKEEPKGPCTLQDGYTANTIGAKYECDFGGGARNFYILELGSNPVSNSTLKSDEVALILEGNYDTTTQTWCDPNGANPSSNVCAADGLTGKLDEIASVWTKLERSQIGLPSALQIIVANNPSKNIVECTSGIQSWLYSWDNPVWGDTVDGYWTSTPMVEDARIDSAYHVLSNARLNYNTVDYDNGWGVRPVVNLKI